MKLPRTWLLAAAFGMACVAARAQSGQDNQVVPGKRMGPVFIGMSPKALLAAMGEPAQSYAVPKTDWYRYRWVRGSEYFVVDVDAHGVKSILSNWASLATPDGTKVGDSQLKVSVALGRPAVTRAVSAEDILLTCYRNGLEVDFKESTLRVMQFSVDEGHPLARCGK